MGDKLSVTRLVREAGVGHPRAREMVARVRASAPVGFQSEKAAQRAESIEEERRQDGFMEGIDEEIREEIDLVVEEFDEVVEIYPNPLLVRFRDAGIARKARGDWPVGLRVPVGCIKDDGGHKWVEGRPRTRGKW